MRITQTTWNYINTSWGRPGNKTDDLLSNTIRWILYTYVSNFQTLDDGGFQPQHQQHQHHHYQHHQQQHMNGRQGGPRNPAASPKPQPKVLVESLEAYYISIQHSRCEVFYISTEYSMYIINRRKFITLVYNIHGRKFISRLFLFPDLFHEVLKLFQVSSYDWPASGETEYRFGRIYGRIIMLVTPIKDPTFWPAT